MTTVSSQAPSAALRVKGRSPLEWAMRRASIGLAILVVTIAGAAWLLYAAIEPDADGNADAQAALRKGAAVVATPANAATEPASSARQ